MSGTPTLAYFYSTRTRHTRDGGKWLLTMEQWSSLWTPEQYENKGVSAGRFCLFRIDPLDNWHIGNCEVRQIAPKKRKTSKPNRNTTAMLRKQLDHLGLPSRTELRTLTVAQWVAEVRRG